MRVFQHVVFFSCPDMPAEVHEALAKIAASITKEISGLVAFSYSVNEVASDGFTHTVIATLKDAAALPTYRAHKAHKPFVDLIMAHSKKLAYADTYVDTYPEFALYGHTMMSAAGDATAAPGGFVGK